MTPHATPHAAFAAPRDRSHAHTYLLAHVAVAFIFVSTLALANPAIEVDALKKARVDSGAPAIGAMVASASGAPVIRVDGIRELGKPDAVMLDDRWHVGSVAKSMTSTLVGRLVDQGKLRFDATLAELLPGMPMRDEYKKVTLLQLTQHRGGIVALTRPNPELNKLLDETTGDSRVKAEAAARWILNQPPVAVPGTKMDYSNGGYALLGHIVERTMKDDYRALMKREVFAPLGMTSADFGWPIDFSTTAPRGHGPGPNGIEPAPADYRLPPHLDPAGNVSASLADLARYLQAHMAALKGSDKFLKPATAKRLHQAAEASADGRRYASGWSIATLPAGGTRHAHNGSAGTFYAEIAFTPESDIVAAVVTNAAPKPDKRPPVQSALLHELLKAVVPAK
jgi:CubicO group peptidase (beta-lactamase class C family)